MQSPDTVLVELDMLFKMDTYIQSRNSVSWDFLKDNYLQAFELIN